MHDKIKRYISRDNPPSISELIILMSCINDYSVNDPNSKTVNIDHLKEIMTNFYQFGPTRNILATIEKINIHKTKRCNL